jgi:mycothiol synthase
MGQIDNLAPADLGALTHLAARALDRDELPADLLRRMLFADPGYDSRLSLCDRQGGKLLGVAVGVVRQRQEKREGYVRLVATDPDTRCRGIAAGLLTELERRLAADGVKQITVGTEWPNWIFPGVEAAYTPAVCMFERRGYTRTGETTNVAVDLVGGDFDTADQEAVLADRGVLVRRLEEADRDAFGRYMAEQWSEGWRIEGLAALDATPPAGFIALGQGKPVGFSVYDIARPGWLGPIGTDKEQRSHGIGSVLLKRCLRDWQLAGRRVGEIAWIGPMYFYSRVASARVCRVYWQYRKDLSGPG